MAGRTITSYRQKMWDMARFRLRDFRVVSWGNQTIPLTNGGNLIIPVGTTIGTIVTSEKLTALMLRWHIRAPGDVVGSGAEANAILRTALSNAVTNNPRLNWQGVIADWGDDIQEALCDEYYLLCQNSSQDGVPTTTEYINDWPNWAGNNSNPRRYQLADPEPLSIDADSFNFDDTGLQDDPEGQGNPEDQDNSR